ncbi:MAG: 4Fe-4S cluster-binding domain-containing protein [Candidatus Woesearchaeota archaeon]|nr:4Fe-4S cluster-binding domain-containing protein [Candidatus Woesearchaeota archaeon]
MQAYIAGITTDSDESWKGHKSIIVFFSGCNFKCSHCYNSDILSFNEEFLTDTRAVKNRILSENILFRPFDSVLFTGGEPTLQRQALLSIARFSRKEGLKIRLETNCSKPEAIKSLLMENLLDSVMLDIKAPLEPMIFKMVTKSETFFKKTEEIMKDISETMRLLKDNDDSIEIDVKTKIIPGIMYKREHILQIAELINGLKCRWEIGLCENADFSEVAKKPSLFYSTRYHSNEFLSETRHLKESIKEKFPDINVEVKF